MKVATQMFQIGGVVYKPLPMLPQRESAPSQASSAREEISSDDTKQVADNGISSDVTQYREELNNAYLAYSAMSETLRNSWQGQAIRRTLKGDGKLNIIKRNKDRFDAILADKKKAMGEYAISDGQVMVKDQETGALENMSLSKYAQVTQAGDKKYKAITNGELANLREKDPRFAYNDEVFNVLEKATSTDEVVKQIRESLANLGSYTKGSSDVSYQQQQIAEGAEGALNQGMSYMKTSEGSFNQSNARNIKDAGNAMWAALDEPAKDLLRIKAIHYGYKPEQIEGAAMGLAMALLKPATREIVKENEGEGKPSTAKKTTGSGSDLKGDKGWWQGVGSGSHAQGTMQLVKGNSKVTIKGNLSPGGFMKSGTGGYYGTAKLSDIKELGSIADMSNISFGDKHLAVEDLDKMIVPGGKGVLTAPMPWTTDLNGNIIPDLDRGENLILAQDELKKQAKSFPAGIPVAIKKAIYEKYDFDDLDEHGDLIAESLKPFVMFDAVGNDTMFDGAVDNVEVDRSDKTFDWYKKFYTDDKGKLTYEKLDGSWGSPSTWFSNPNILKGVVYIPLTKAAGYGGMYGDTGKVKQSEIYNADATYNTNQAWGKGGTNEIQQSYNRDFSTNSLK